MVVVVVWCGGGGVVVVCGVVFLVVGFRFGGGLVCARLAVLAVVMLDDVLSGLVVAVLVADFAFRMGVIFGCVTPGVVGVAGWDRSVGQEDSDEQGDGSAKEEERADEAPVT